MPSKASRSKAKAKEKEQKRALSKAASGQVVCLPIEILCQIFHEANFSSRETASLRHVCRGWQNAVDSIKTQLGFLEWRVSDYAGEDLEERRRAPSLDMMVEGYFPVAELREHHAWRLQEESTSVSFDVQERESGSRSNPMDCDAFERLLGDLEWPNVKTLSLDLFYFVPDAKSGQDSIQWNGSRLVRALRSSLPRKDTKALETLELHEVDADFFDAELVDSLTKTVGCVKLFSENFGRVYAYIENDAARKLLQETAHIIVRAEVCDDTGIVSDMPEFLPSISQNIEKLEITFDSIDWQRLAIFPPDELTVAHVVEMPNLKYLHLGVGPGAAPRASVRVSLQAPLLEKVSITPLTADLYRLSARDILREKVTELELVIDVGNCNDVGDVILDQIQHWTSLTTLKIDFVGAHEKSQHDANADTGSFRGFSMSDFFVTLTDFHLSIPLHTVVITGASRWDGVALYGLFWACRRANVPIEKLYIYGYSWEPKQRKAYKTLAGELKYSPDEAETPWEEIDSL